MVKVPLLSSIQNTNRLRQERSVNSKSIQLIDRKGYRKSDAALCGNAAGSYWIWYQSVCRVTQTPHIFKCFFPLMTYLKVPLVLSQRHTYPEPGANGCSENKQIILFNSDAQMFIHISSPCLESGVSIKEDGTEPVSPKRASTKAALRRLGFRQFHNGSFWNLD